MPPQDSPSTLRGFALADAKRGLVSFAALVLLSGCYWFLLSGLQSWMIPAGAGGETGPWVVRPILAFHFCAAALMAAVTAPFLLGALRKRWNREDAAQGSRFDPFAGRPVRRALFLIRGGLLVIVYLAALLFYLRSWVVIGPAGIEQHLPWATLHHSFQDIATLETIPEGQRSDSLRQDGPWYSISLQSGRAMTWSLDNEGITREELAAIARFVAERSGRAWERWSDARAR